MQIDAVPRNLVAHHGKLKRLVRAFAQNRDVNGRALRPLQQVSHIARCHVVSRLAIHRRDNVPRVYAGPVSWSSREWRNNDDLIVPRPHRHSHAVVFAALVLAQ